MAGEALAKKAARRAATKSQHHMMPAFLVQAHPHPAEFSDFGDTDLGRDLGDEAVQVNRVVYQCELGCRRLVVGYDFYFEVMPGFCQNRVIQRTLGSARDVLVPP